MTSEYDDKSTDNQNQTTSAPPDDGGNPVPPLEPATNVIDREVDLLLRSFIYKTVWYLKDPDSLFSGTTPEQRKNRIIDGLDVLKGLNFPFASRCPPCPKFQTCNLATGKCEDTLGKVQIRMS